MERDNIGISLLQQLHHLQFFNLIFSALTDNTIPKVLPEVNTRILGFPNILQYTDQYYMENKLH